MRLTHLGLTVADRERSRRFYETYFGFGARPATRYEDGTLIIRDVDGFDLALHEGTPAPTDDFMHFGFRCAGPEEVRALGARLTAADVTVTDSHDLDWYVSFKALDPDGYPVEVYWER
jgi:catechol 2,3-dioxygenase-like lactoylglutathione lyase family enzyme